MHISNLSTSPLYQAYRGSHFAPAFYFLSSERRQALKILYAAFRMLDDAVDNPVGNPVQLLSSWEEFCDNGTPEVLSKWDQDGLTKDLVSVLKTYDIPIVLFKDCISYGLKKDMGKVRFETSMDLESYCYGVAGTVGVACLPIFGVPWTEAKEFAIRLGIAIQWVNIIRDVGQDALMNRIYLPLDHLEKFGYEQTDLLARRTNEAFFQLVQYEVQTARQHYQRALELLPIKWYRELLPARIMGKIYFSLLAKIEKHNYAVLERRIQLNFFEKGWATWKAVRN